MQAYLGVTDKCTEVTYGYYYSLKAYNFVLDPHFQDVLGTIAIQDL